MGWADERDDEWVDASLLVTDVTGSPSHAGGNMEKSKTPPSLWRTERLLDCRRIRTEGLFSEEKEAEEAEEAVEYLVKWTSFPVDQSTWEPEDSIPAAIVKDYQAEKRELVQCDGLTCRRWRELPLFVSASSLPRRWYCSMAHWRKKDPYRCGHDGPPGSRANPKNTIQSNSCEVMKADRNEECGVEEIEEVVEKEVPEECAVCLDPLQTEGGAAAVVTLGCGHRFCRSCVDRMAEMGSHVTTRRHVRLQCPLCRQAVAGINF
eukprot:CAMPEP_0185784554 /NCGR_PEP_ID=MMETSP1174-20130828/123926_1 /TAXON_ID=35687 /ORGANISM="Dictyocha speculum, Strain CCMP1381" /LENGTH=262 /DNA_ID=CAMNT_0028476203 /DNA_START=65 /DNA_END=853 /DNA_ORIENTATION=-